MPDLGGTPKRRKLDLSGVKVGKQDNTEETPKPSKGAPASGRRTVVTGTGKVTRATSRNAGRDDEDDEEDPEEEDEIIQSSLQSGGNKFTSNKLLMGGAMALVAIVVIILFLLMHGGGKEDPPPVTGSQPPVTSSDAPATPSETFSDPNLGIQDFTQDTNMTSDSPLSNPDGYVEDIYGLTTRVEYEVSAIQEAVDFVNYTKHRGTWGGGVELYWLDCTYKGNRYVIQVPFKYYKELDDTGIVPVKMEVLYSKQATGETLTIISYMCLDEEVLKAVLKSANK